MRGYFTDEIVFAYLPVPLKTDARDQNVITFFSLRPSDITTNGISIPSFDGGMMIEQASWKQILSTHQAIRS